MSAKKREKIVIPQRVPRNNTAGKPYLDKWTEPQIHLLKAEFNKFAERKRLSFEGFIQLFPGLSESLKRPSYSIFDGNNAKSIDFTEFWLGLSKIIMSSRKEKADFIFALFDRDQDGILSIQESHTMLESCKTALRPLSIDMAENLQKHQEILNKNEKVTNEAFQTWSLRNMEIDIVLEAFEVIPSPAKERQIIKNIMKKFAAKTLLVGEVVYIISKRWWDTWKNYVHYAERLANYEKSMGEYAEVMPMNVQEQPVTGDKPVSIDNTDILIPGKKEIEKGLVQNVQYIVLPLEAWEHLTKWYGGGPELSRKVTEGKSRPKIDLYPRFIKFQLRGEDGHPIENTFKEIQIPSNNRYVEEILGKLQSTYDLQIIHKIWHKQNDRWLQLRKRTPIPPIIDVILLDSVDGLEAPEKRKWDDFQADDDVDIQRAPGFWVTGKIIHVTDTEIEIKLEKENKVELFARNSADIAPSGSKVSKMTRIKYSEVEGGTGMLNTGNTCYLNCTVQCLSSTPLLKAFFTSGNFEHYINTENENGSKGAVTTEFGNLLKSLWNKRFSFVRPTKFQETVVAKHSDFAGNDQHDVHEFLGFLLDTLHEDLLRANLNVTTLTRQISRLRNPKRQEEIEYAEKQWIEHMRARGSVISDLMGGQTRTTIECQTCMEKTILFESFMLLSVPIPVSSIIPLTVVSIPRGTTKFTQYVLEINKYATLGDLQTAVSQITGISEEKFMLAQVISNRISMIYNFDEKEILSRLGIRDEIYAYEVAKTVEDFENESGRHVLAYDTGRKWGDFKLKDQVDWKDEQTDWQTGVIAQLGEIEVVVQLDGVPTYIKGNNTLTFETTSPSLAPFRKHTKPTKVETFYIPMLFKDTRGAFMCSPILLPVGSWFTWDNTRRVLENAIEPFWKHREFRLLILDLNGFHWGYCAKGINCKGCEPDDNDGQFMPWLLRNYKRITFAIEWQQDLAVTWEEHNSYTTFKSKPVEDPLDLSHCFEEFIKPEELELTCDKWTTRQKAMQQMELWRLPEIMVIHLKRFTFESGNAEKIDLPMDFPIFAFDANQWVRSIDSSIGRNRGLTLSSTALQNTYDLFAVVNHMGSIGGGHYTAFCKHEDTGKWYLYNDDEVLEVHDDPENFVINRNAYVLFYRKRMLSTSNLIELQES